MTTGSDGFCKKCLVLIGEPHRRGCSSRSQERWDNVHDRICWWPIVEAADCSTALDTASARLGAAMIDVAHATDAEGLKVFLVNPMNIDAVKLRYTELSRLLVDVIAGRAKCVDFQSRYGEYKGRVVLANHVKLLTELLEAYWEYENAKGAVK